MKFLVSKFQPGGGVTSVVEGSVQCVSFLIDLVMDEFLIQHHEIRAQCLRVCTLEPAAGWTGEVGIDAIEEQVNSKVPEETTMVREYDIVELKHAAFGQRISEARGA